MQGVSKQFLSKEMKINCIQSASFVRLMCGIINVLVDLDAGKLQDHHFDFL